MDASLPSLLEQLSLTAQRSGLTQRDWATKAGLRSETLSRLKSRGDCDLATLNALADAVGLRVGLLPATEVRMPAHFGREEEEVLLDLAASGSLDVRAWREAGEPFFMAGLAVLLAGAPGFDRAMLLTLAEALCPGISTMNMFETWLQHSPLRPSRFLPMLRQRMGQ
ncbi:MAG: hypothetical protein JNN20_11380 [Betaproteobacteria bacterium]|nr:hypothetical protein [Betaproteobacteria bacterium]